MHDPVISEAGRKFLADLLAKLSETQIHDLFEVARFPLRKLQEPPLQPERVTTDDWMRAFKTKRDEIASHHCPD